MKKFILVLFIGMALALDIYGLVNEFMVKDVNEIDHIEETTITVYME